MQDDSNRISGVVKWFSGSKGYGFLERKDGGKDVFVHYSSIEGDGYKSLNEGDAVTFVTSNTPKGLQADSVRVTSI